MRVKGSTWSISNIFAEKLSSLGGLFLSTLWWFSLPAVVGSNQVLMLELLTLELTFLTTYLKWVGTIWILHSLSTFIMCGSYAGLRNNYRVIHHVGSVLILFPCATVVHMQWFFFLELLTRKQRDLCILWKVLHYQSSWTSHMLCCGCTRPKFMGPCVLCGCSVESYFFCGLCCIDLSWKLG